MNSILYDELKIRYIVAHVTCNLQMMLLFRDMDRISNDVRIEKNRVGNISNLSMLEDS